MTDQSIFASCTTFCGRYGCDCCSCGGERGFCHSCFDGRFNNDSWDREESEQQQQQQQPIDSDPSNTNSPAADSETPATTKEQNTEKVLNTEQPQPIAEMNPSNTDNSQSL
ncbi:hypothetical protein Clacol_008793 [Clathrus columnatus]|uniref:Uncharacterized protein n=1 Tax=Clathrus columnatus TaxID=1419009 RepID=A0AAV5AN92_9AGAM|nr:hypothetical protein Clacol_008793 [Clathrus columnatus]